jgi:hypothetical protein
LRIAAAIAPAKIAAPSPHLRSRVEIKVAMDCVGDPTLIATRQSSDTAYNVPEIELGMSGRIERARQRKRPSSRGGGLQIKIAQKPKGLSAKPLWIP